MTPLAFVCPVWNERYVHDWLTWSLPTLLTAGNIPSANAARFFVLTRPDDVRTITMHPSFMALSSQVSVEIMPVDNVIFSDTTRLHMMGLDAALTMDRDCAVCFLNSDILVSDGLYRTVRESVDKGYRAVLTQGIPVPAGKVVGSRVPQWIWEIPPREMVRLILDISDQGQALPQWRDPFPHHLAQLFWLFDGGFIQRCPQLYPIMVRPKDWPKMSGSIDNDLVQNCGLEVDDIDFLTDSDRGCFISIEHEPTKTWGGQGGPPSIDAAAKWYQSVRNRLTDEFYRRGLIFRAEKTQSEQFISRINESAEIVGKIIAAA